MREWNVYPSAQRCMYSILDTLLNYSEQLICQKYPAKEFEKEPGCTTDIYLKFHFHNEVVAHFALGNSVFCYKSINQNMN